MKWYWYSVGKMNLENEHQLNDIFHVFFHTNTGSYKTGCGILSYNGDPPNNATQSHTPPSENQCEQCAIKLKKFNKYNLSKRLADKIERFSFKFKNEANMLAKLAKKDDEEYCKKLIAIQHLTVNFQDVIDMLYYWSNGCVEINYTSEIERLTYELGRAHKCACVGCLSASAHPELHTCEDGMMREMLEYLRVPVEAALRKAPKLHEVGVPDGNVEVKWTTSFHILRELIKLLDK